MLADKSAGFGRHYFEFQRTRHMPGAPDFQRRKDAVVPDAIAVGLFLCRETRVKIIANIAATHDANARRQRPVHRGHPLFDVQLSLWNIDVRTLRERVNTGVGSSGAVHAQIRARDFRERMLEAILNRVATRLALPAIKRRAVVGDDELKPVRHSIARRTGAAVEITLQDHLRGNLIDHAASVLRFATGITQRAIRRRSR